MKSLLTSIIFVIFLFSAGSVSSEENDNLSLKNGTEVEGIESTVVKNRYRLSNSTVPVQYDLKLKFSKESYGKIEFGGEVTILIEIKSETDKIEFHRGKSLLINDIFISNSEKGKVEIISINYDDKTEIMMLNLDGKLPNLSMTSLTISYNGGELTKSTTGFYTDEIEAKNETSSEIYRYISTNFKRNHARNAFPCFDEPQLKATFAIAITCPSSFEHTANIPLNEKNFSTNENDTADNETKLFTLESSNLMSPDQVGIFLSNFELKNEPKRNVTLWATFTSIDQTDYALEVMTKAQEFYAKYFDVIKDPLDIKEIVAVPNSKPDAIGQVGRIVVPEQNLLYHPDHTSDLQKQEISTAVFRIWASSYVNLVTPKWWDASWINDALATYLAYNATDEVEPEWKMDQLFVVDHLQSALIDDALVSSKALERNIETPTEIQEIDDKMIRSKGASILRMLHLSVNPSFFRNSLKTYLEERMHQTSTPNDFWSFYQAELDADSIISATDITKFMNTWTTQPGYPLVTVTVINNIVSVNQQRFTYDNSDSNSTESPIWHFPLTWVRERKPDFENVISDYWLTISDKVFTTLDISQNEWIIFNAQQSGFYRVNYETNIWNQIIRALQSENFGGIPVINRAAIIDDLFNLARAGRVEYSMALSAAKYLINETSYIPWKAAINNFNFIRDRIGDLQRIFKNFVVSLLEPHYPMSPFDENKNETHDEKMFRMHIYKWACDYGHEKCDEDGKKEFENWKRHLLFQKMDPNFSEAIFATSVYTDVAAWNFLWDKYSNEPNYTRSEKHTIIKALSQTRMTDKIRELLSDAINPNKGISIDDSLTIFSTICSHGEIVKMDITLQFIEEQFDNILKYFQDYDSIKQILTDVSSRLMTINLINQFEKIVTTNQQKLEPIEDHLKLCISKAQQNLKWFEAFDQKIFASLDGVSSVIDLGHPWGMKPEHYDMFIEPSEDYTQFGGKITIRLVSTTEISNIMLNARKLEIQEVSVAINNTEPIRTKFYHSDIHSKLIIPLGRSVPPSTTLKLHIEYNGFINKSGGIYRIPYRINNETQWLIATQFRKYGAASLFPCIESPGLQSDFNINILRSNHHQTLSNLKFASPIFHQKDERRNRTWDMFSSVTKTSPENIAFIVGNITQEILKDNSTDLGRYIDNLKNIKTTLFQFLDDYTDVKRPMDLIYCGIIPNVYIEHPETMDFLTFNEFELPLTKDRYNDIPIDLLRDKYLAVVNKFVNIWLRKQIVPQHMIYMWLNEGLAQYLQWLIADQLWPEFRFMDQFVVYELQNAMLIDSNDVTQERIQNYDLVDSDVRYSNGSNYGKAASLFHMLKKAYKDEEYQKSLQLYFNKCVNTPTIPNCLWQQFQATLRKTRHGSHELIRNSIEIRKSMGMWINNRGYPVLDATYDNKTLTLNQHKLVLSGKNKTKNSNDVYWLPISIATKSKLDFNNTLVALSLNKPHATTNKLELEDSDWYVLNVQETGFYRVNYDVKNWNKLLAALNDTDFGGIPEINRAQIVDDLINLARADYISYELAFDGIEYLVNERSHLPWKAFFNAIDYLCDRFDGRNVSNAFKNYIHKLIKPIYEELGFEQKLDDTLMDRLNRQLIVSWACKVGYPDCVKTSREIFNQLRDNPLSVSISPDVKQTVLCTAMKYGNKNDWDFLQSRNYTSSFEWEISMVLKALGCSKNQTTINEYLNYISLMNTHEGTMRKDHYEQTLLSVAASGHDNLKTTYNFLKQNYQNLYDFYDSWELVTKLFSIIAEKIPSSDESNVNLMELPFLQNVTFQTSLPNYMKIVKLANDNIKWYENHVAEIERLLMKRGFNSTNIQNIESIYYNKSDNHFSTSSTTIISPLATTIAIILILVIGL